MLIIAFGDIHMERETAKRIPDIDQADCLVVTGDLTVCGGRPEAQSVLTALFALNPRVYAQIGNMDLSEVEDMLTEMEINLNGRGVRLDQVGLFGLGGSNPTPFNTPSEFSEEELERQLRKAYEDVKDARFKVLFSHTPPLNTQLDRVRGGVHVGSRAVRQFLEKTDCDVCVCGHIHESVGTDRLGATLIINPGMLVKGGYVRIEFRDDQLSASLEKC